MTQENTYTCEHCGKDHVGFPAIAFITPYHYDTLSEEDKQSLATINEDFCVIEHDTQTDYFIRTILRQKIIGSCDFLDYGIWVSLSEKSYTNYSDNFYNDNHVTTYFGFLCSQIPEYENTLSIKTTVHTQPENARPVVVPHDDQTDHPFVADYYNGITEEEAIKRVNAMRYK